MDDAAIQKALLGLVGDHRRAVVGQQRAGQAPLLEGLTERVD